MSANELPDSHYEELVAEGIIERGESIEYFYSEGMLSIMEGGSVLTNARVIAYERIDDGTINYYSIPHNDIVSVTLIQEGDAMTYAVYQVNTAEEDYWLNLLLPHEYGDGERFANAVRAKIGQQD